jgi:hypothetical protein
MLWDAVRKDRIADGYKVIIPIAVDDFIAGPARAYLVDHNIFAVLYRYRIFGFLLPTNSIIADPDMADDHVIGVLDEQRRAGLGATVMGDRNASARCCLASNCEVRIFDNGRRAIETEYTANAKYAGAWPNGFNTCAQGTGDIIGCRGYLDNLALKSAQSGSAIAYSTRKRL